LSLDKFKKIIQLSFGKDPPPEEFLINIFQNAVIDSSKLFYNNQIIDSDNGEKYIFLKIDDDCTFIESNTLGLIFYNLYFSKQYKSQSCFITYNTISQEQTINNFLNEIISIHKQIEEYVITGKKDPQTSNLIKSLASYYDWYIDPNLNCNYYVFTLMDIVSKINSTGYEIIYDETKDSEQFIASNELQENISKCLSSSSRFIIIPLQIIYKEYNVGHTNLLLVDKQTMKIERFEPHGTSQAEENIVLNEYLDKFFKKFGIKYIEPKECPYPSVQKFIESEEDIPSEYTNKCVTHSYGYLEYRIKRGLDYKQATNVYYDDVKKKGFLHLKEIVEKNQKIFSEQQKNLDKINQYFGSSLVFDKGNISFTSKCKNQNIDYPIIKIKEPIDKNPKKRKKKAAKGTSSSITKEQKISNDNQ
jgi:hypothetical protein